MALKEIVNPVTKKKYKMGRTRAVSRGPCLQLKNYIKKLVAPTLPVDYSKLSLAALRKMYLNDTEGDCVIAGGYHVRGVTSGNSTNGNPILFTDIQVNQDYSAIGGYVPGNPATDQGCNEQDALNYWVQTGFPDGVNLQGWVAVDPTNVSELQIAISIFENLIFGLELPDSWINPMPSTDGFVWDAVGRGDPQNGHCVIGYGATSVGISICTWAMLGTMTYKAIAEYCLQRVSGEVYTVLSPDIVSKLTQTSPNNIAWADLISDLHLLNGTPTPTPTPVPVPVPAEWQPLYTECQFLLKQYGKAIVPYIERLLRRYNPPASVISAINVLISQAR